MNERKLTELAKQKGLEILEATIKINESGVDFQVAHAKDDHGTKWILRVPRRPESMRHASQEKNALDLIKKQSLFQVPDWSIFSDELIAYQELNGVPAATIDIEKQGYVWTFDETNVPKAYDDSLGNTLAQLHSLNKSDFKKIGVEFLRADELITSMKQRMNYVKERYTIHPQLWERWQAWLANESVWPNFVGVKHGDLHPGHVLIDKNHSVTGLIDWTEVGVADVSIDFMSHLLLFGKDGLTKLINAYDNAGGKTWSGMEAHITELLTTSAITVAEFAEVSGMEDMHEAAKQMLASAPE